MGPRQKMTLARQEKKSQPKRKPKVTSDEESDSDIEVLPSAVEVKKVRNRKQAKDTSEEESSESDMEVAPARQNVKKGPQRKAKDTSDEESESDLEVAPARQAVKKGPSRKQTNDTSDDESESDSDMAASSDHQEVKKSAVRKTKDTSEEESESDVEEAPARQPAKKGTKRKPTKATSDEESENDRKRSKPSKKPVANKKETAGAPGEFSPDCAVASPAGKQWNMKITSWNVNGVRAWLQKKGLEYLAKEDPNMFCVMETKCPKDKIPEACAVDGYKCYWLSGDTDGYSGVGLYTKIKPINVSYGIGIDEHDKEGRVITAEYDKFYLVLTYVPNSGRKLVRLDYRMKWDFDFLNYLKNLDSKKPVILCGDLNVAHQEIDIANPKNNKRNAGFTQEERDGFTNLLDAGFVDSYRHLNPDTKAAYTFWTYMMNARAKDVGWRLDYFVLSKQLVPKMCDSVIRKTVMGSDHCPITLYMAM